MKLLRIFIGFVFFFLSIFVSGSTGQADQSFMGVVEVRTKEANRTITEIQPLEENEAHVMVVRDGVMVGESIVQLQEMDVIIQLKEDPLILLKAEEGKSMALAAANLERVRNQLKAELVRLENDSRGAIGLPARSIQQIVKREYQHVFNGLAARVSREAVEQIEILPQVKKVYPDVKVQACLNESVPLIRANRVWTDLGVTGRGIVVAVIDTGIDYTHPDLGGCLGPSCKVIGGYDFINNDADPMDDHGHGTHCAGIVAANGAIKGVAPDAKLMAVKVLSSEGSGYSSGIIAGIEYAVDPDGNPATNDGADIISMSLGGPGDPNDAMSLAIDNVVAAGVVAAIAAGNSGAPGYGSVSSPGTARQAITVGASDKSDKMAYFSCKGPASSTLQIKPEVTAPGVNITSTVPRGSCQLCDPSGYKPLSGTSMATPHVAGAAALLLERFPSWTPQQVKEALMEPSVNLGLDVFTQGSGRIDAYASATSSVLGSPGNLSLGLDDISQPTFSAHKIMNLTNQTTSSKTYQLSVQGTFPGGMTATVTPSSLILGPGETKSFTFDLTVDNTVVPNPPNPPHAYEGKIVAVGTGETLTFPFAFLKGASMSLTLDAAPLFISIHDRANFLVVLSFPGTSKTVLLPEGTYDVVVSYGDTWIVRENVSVRPTARVNISKAEAIYEITIAPVDKDGNPLQICKNGTCSAAMNRSYFECKTGSYGERGAAWGPVTTFRFSPVSNAYLFESGLQVKGVTTGGLEYTFHAYARDGITGPVRFQNSPTDLKHVRIRYAVDPGLNQVVPMSWLNGMANCIADPPLEYPFEEEAYYLPLPYPEFRAGSIRKFVLRSRNPTNSCDFSSLIYVTPDLRARNRNEIGTYLYGQLEPFYSTNSDHLLVGIGPYVWFGRFENHWELIKVLAPAAGGANLIMGQIGDLRPHDPLTYEVYRNGSLVKTGQLDCVGSPWCGADISWIFMDNYGPTTFKIPYANYVVAGQQGSALVEASFDTSRNGDQNPPYVTQFNVFENGQATDTVVSGRGQVVFTVLDNVALRQVNLFYDAENGWQNLTLNKVGDKYIADIPTFVSNTFVSLKLVADDTSGNRLTYEMKPALLVQVTFENVSTPSAPGGPTSGNPGTSYTYLTGGSSSNLGHSVQYLFDWGDGTYSGWLPVGQIAASKSWISAGTYKVKAQARCATDTSVVSNWSSGLSVTISIPETISTPATPSGPISGNTGISYTYSTGGSSSNFFDHWVQYLFDWGDGTNSGWLPVRTTSASKSWASAGTYNVKAQARCSIDTTVVSSWSQTLAVIISVSETVSTPAIPSGPISGNPSTNYAYSAGGSSSNLGHSVQYFFDWGDGTNSGWLPVGTASASKSWASAGTYNVKAQARCATHTSVVSDWSQRLSVTISVPETISTPSTAGGPTSGNVGVSYTYSTGGSSSNLGHLVQYFFDWGDGTNSGWLPVGTTSASKSWASAGTYNIKAQARCATHTSMVSDWSQSLAVNIVYSWQSESVNWQVYYGSNWNRSGTVTKPGATRIRLHFSTIDLERGYDHLRTDVGNDWSGSYSNVFSNEKSGNSIALTLTSDFSVNGSFVIDRVDWQGPSTGPATRSGDLFGGAPTPQPPSPPTNVSASDGTYTDRVRLTWTASSGATSYKVFRNTSNNSSGAQQIGASTASPYDDLTAVVGTTYWYWVKAYNSAGDSGFSNGDSGVRSANAETISTPSTPSGPTSGSNGTSYSYTTGGSTTSLGHSVQYFFDWGDGTNSGWLPIGTTSASKSWASAGTYTVKAQARCATDTSMVSSWSPGLSVSISPPPPPSPPTSVSASDGTYTDRVRLTWTASSGATGYKVFRNTSNNSSGAQQIGASTASPYDDLTAGVGTTYWYWVKAYNSAGDSGFSNGDSGYVASSSSWQSESVNWTVVYGNNWNKSGTVTKPGATRIRLHFSAISLEVGADHLRTDAGDDWSREYSNVTSREKAGNSMGLTLTSDYSKNGYFVIDRVEWQGTSTGPATKSGTLFQ